MVVAGRGTYVCRPAQRPPLRRRWGDARYADSESAQQLVQATALGGRLHLGEAAEQLAVDQHLGEGHHAGPARQLDPPCGSLEG